MIEKTIGLFPADGLRRELPVFHLRFVGAVCGQRAGGAGAFCVHLEDPAGCAERRAGLCAGGEHPPLRLDGSVVCSAVLPCLHCGTDVLPPVGVPGGDQSAAGGVGAFGGAAAGLCRNFWQRQAAQDHPRKHRSRRDLSCPPAARPVQRHRHPGGAAGAAVGVRLAIRAAEPCAGGAGFPHHGDHDRQADG